jgi:hypothetical protein
LQTPAVTNELQIGKKPAAFVLCGFVAVARIAPPGAKPVINVNRIHYLNTNNLPGLRR